MKKIFEYSSICIKKSIWKDFALLKFCLCSIGVIFGVLLPDSTRGFALVITTVIFLFTCILLIMKFVSVIIKENKERSVGATVQLTLFDEITDTDTEANCSDNGDSYITYYNLDGTYHSKEILNKDSVSTVVGAMTRCTMNNGDTYEGFSSPFRKFGINENSEENYDILYLWTWDNLDEETHQLVGDEETKYKTTYTPVLIDEIKKIDVILFSHPRWGGRLYNNFFIGQKEGK